MSNVTAEASTKRLNVPAFEYEVEMLVRSGVTLYAGAMVVIDSTGALNKGNTASANVVIGRFKHPKYRGFVVGDGVVKARVECGVFLYDNSGTDALAAADVGRLCYVEDDHTVSKTGSTTSLVAGVVFGLALPGTGTKVAVIQGLQNRLGQIIALNATTGTGTTTR